MKTLILPVILGLVLLTSCAADSDTEDLAEQHAEILPVLVTPSGRECTVAPRTSPSGTLCYMVVPQDGPAPAPGDCCHCESTGRTGLWGPVTASLYTCRH